ncbi:MAG: hypothetical protein HC848_03820 [Limnobacter sp.]|nr:hypothetical protein [Limnobacter sp.]
MDLWNNEVGRRLGDSVYSKEELAKQLAGQLNNGQLVTSLNDPRLKQVFPSDPRLKLPIGDRSGKF